MAKKTNGETEVIQTHRFTCIICFQAFSNVHQLILHNNDVHDGIKHNDSINFHNGVGDAERLVVRLYDQEKYFDFNNSNLGT